MKRLSIIAFALLVNACSSSPAKMSAVGVYGNWCGYDHPSDMSTAAPPVDELDAICMRHDYCYVEKGQFACECDKALNEELQANLSANKYQGQQKHFARSFHHYFKGSPCAGTPDGKLGPSKALQNIYKGTKKKAIGLYDRLVGTPAEPPAQNEPPESDPANQEGAEDI